jgi:hypothetical protein
MVDLGVDCGDFGQNAIKPPGLLAREVVVMGRSL